MIGRLWPNHSSRAGKSYWRAGALVGALHPVCCSKSSSAATPGRSGWPWCSLFWAFDSVQAYFLWLGAEPRTKPVFEVLTWIEQKPFRTTFCLQFFGRSSPLLGNSTFRMSTPLIVTAGTSATSYSNISRDSFNAWCFRRLAFKKCCGRLSLLFVRRRFDLMPVICWCQYCLASLRVCPAGRARTCY